MRSQVEIFVVCFVLLAQQAGANSQIAKIDTLVREPAQARDLPELLVKWLVSRDLLIPYYGEYYGDKYGNTVIGSFMGENTRDCAVLTIPRGAYTDRCSLWVFPSCDTLAPMLLGKFLASGGQWQMSYEMESVLEYRWCIRPYGPYSQADLKAMRIDKEGLPEISHQGIYVLQAEKDPYPFYYYNGNEWLQLPLGE